MLPSYCDNLQTRVRVSDLNDHFRQIPRLYRCK
jgi:hypothetical protein